MLANVLVPSLSTTLTLLIWPRAGKSRSGTWWTTVPHDTNIVTTGNAQKLTFMPHIVRQRAFDTYANYDKLSLLDTYFGGFLPATKRSIVRSIGKSETDTLPESLRICPSRSFN